MRRAWPAGSACTTTRRSRSGWLLGQGAERIAYVDIDVHHGDGVAGRLLGRSAGADDQPARAPDDPLPRHRRARPRTAGPAPRAWPSTWRCRPAPVTRAGCARSTRSCRRCCARSARRSWSPSTGATRHRLDPLAHLELSIDGQRTAQARLHHLAHETAGGRWVLTGGGGYELVHVVPRTWTHLLAEAAGGRWTRRPHDPRRLAGLRPGPHRRAPRRRPMTEGAPASFSPFSSGYDPGDRVDRAIMATRNADLPAARAAAIPLTRVS